ncbi:hypothetical protein ALC57_03787 [Trachymyrmex cornetzi]|uniref:Uncharacterized protein n=1 Tax=Trachymyrmex cornetzi TaxID=471704 RepID=A0A195EF09_9HYME|nr:hypothetical protein ALC57_03787 [Trachymyrmex cornetzi]
MTPSTTISLLWLFTVAIRAIPFPSWHLQECDTYKDVRIIDICGADERARQPTGGKGPRITSGGPYSPRRSDQTCVHPVLSALAGLLARGENSQEFGAKRRGEKKRKRPAGSGGDGGGGGDGGMDVGRVYIASPGYGSFKRKLCRVQRVCIERRRVDRRARTRDSQKERARKKGGASRSARDAAVAAERANERAATDRERENDGKERGTPRQLRLSDRSFVRSFAPRWRSRKYEEGRHGSKVKGRNKRRGPVSVESDGDPTQRGNKRGFRSEIETS